MENVSVIFPQTAVFSNVPAGHIYPSPVAQLCEFSHQCSKCSLRGEHIMPNSTPSREVRPLNRSDEEINFFLLFLKESEFWCGISRREERENREGYWGTSAILGERVEEGKNRKESKGWKRNIPMNPNPVFYPTLPEQFHFKASEGWPITAYPWVSFGCERNI